MDAGFRQSGFKLLSRYEANLFRAYDRTLKQIIAVRKAIPAPNSDPPLLPFAPRMRETHRGR